MNLDAVKESDLNFSLFFFIPFHLLSSPSVTSFFKVSSNTLPAVTALLGLLLQ
jgi:hypothetical protein